MRNKFEIKKRSIGTGKRGLFDTTMYIDILTPFNLAISLFSEFFWASFVMSLTRDAYLKRKNQRLAMNGQTKMEGSLIGHFRVPLGLCIKTRLSAQPLVWKWFFILMQIKLIFTRRVLHLADTWPHFESEGFWESDVAYSFRAPSAE